MRYVVVGMIVGLWLMHTLRWMPTGDPEVPRTIGAPWWLMPLAPTFIFAALVVRRFLKDKEK